MAKSKVTSNGNDGGLAIDIRHSRARTGRRLRTGCRACWRTPTAVPEDAQFPLNVEGHVQHAAPDVHGPVHGAVDRARRDRGAHPLVGYPAPGTYADFARLSKIGTPRACPRRWRWRLLVRGHETVARTARNVFKAADKGGDESTADLLTQRLQVHEKTRGC